MGLKFHDEIRSASPVLKFTRYDLLAAGARRSSDSEFLFPVYGRIRRQSQQEPDLCNKPMESNLGAPLSCQRP